MTVTVDLPADLEARLTALSERTGRSLVEYVQEAVSDLANDLEDAQMIEDRIAEVGLLPDGSVPWDLVYAVDGD